MVKFPVIHRHFTKPEFRTEPRSLDHAAAGARRALCAVILAGAAGTAQADTGCGGTEAGAYALPSGPVIVLTPSAKPIGLRWTHEDGRTGFLQPDASGNMKKTRGWSEEADHTRIELVECGASLAFEGETAARVDLQVRETSFDVGGTRFVGRLVRPAEAGEGHVPLVIEVQGSGRGSHLVSNHRQYLLPARGIAVFVYDKRGTGRSAGQYTQDFHVLARDAAAAFEHAWGLSSDGSAPRGFVGSSQGGWVAPLAAQQVPADFVIVNYGLAYSALREDREQVLLGMRAAGWDDPGVLRKAAAVADAAGRVVARKGDEDMQRMAELREAHGQEAWWKDLGGEFTGFIANTPAEELARLGPSMDVGTSWDYDPMPTLRSVPARQLWLVAGKDAEAPPEETLRRLRVLQAEGRPVTLVTFPDADHGLRQFEIVEGERRGIRYAPGAHRVIVDWIRDGGLAPRGDETFIVDRPQ